MKNDCPCSGNQSDQPALIALSAAHLSQLSSSSSQRLLGVSKSLATAKDRAGAAGVAPTPEATVHVTPEGDALVTTSFADGSSGDIVVRGTIAGIPYELHIKVALEGSQVAVTLHLTKPIEIGPYTWRFDLGGVVKNSGGQIIAASSIAPASDFQPMGINWWCAVKCGGAAILPVLIACLPAMTGGPAAYVACVTGKLGAGSAAEIAMCIAQKCL